MHSTTTNPLLQLAVFALFVVAKVQSFPESGIAKFNPTFHSGTSVRLIDIQDQSEEIEFPRALKESTTSVPGFAFGKVDPQRIKRNLCPGVTQNLEQYRYDARQGKCSRVGQQSHCGENMAFYGVTHNEIYGECDCLYNSMRPLIYHAETKRCYFAYEQAYCRRGEWLSFARNGKAGCSFNKCQTPVLTNVPWRTKVYVPLNGDGSCVLLGQKSDLCRNDEHIVSFVLGELTPRCIKPEPGTRALALSRQLKCRAGTYLNIVGRCQPPFIW